MAECPHPSKRRYGSKPAALHAIRSMYRHGEGSPDLNAYLCRCGAWHVGHNPKWLNQRIRRALRGTRGSRKRKARR